MERLRFLIKGQKLQIIYERHRVLSQMLESIGVSKETALADACKMEHDISQETFEKIKEYFLKNMKEETE